MRVVYMPCAVSPSASLGAAVERIQRALDETPAVSVAFSQTGSAPPTDAAPMLLYTPIWPVGPGPVVVLSPPVSRVPEPASWAMFIGGFGLVGATMRAKASKAHPDAGGSDAAMARLNAARDQGRRERG